MMFATASTSDYASSPSGVVITILVGALLVLVAFVGRQLSSKVDDHAKLIGTLDKTVAVLSTTVDALKQAIAGMTKHKEDE